MTHTFQLSDCPIHLGDLRDTFPAWLRERSYSQVFLLTDENTHRHCLPIFLEKTGLPREVNIAKIPAGERFKTLATCQQIWQQMLDAKLDRRALVVNLGGGVIGDMGGFCAATWKRGVDFAQIPTTLLAMTDAAIGGKLGIDFQGVKNTIGIFQNPAAVFVDPVFLKTLPDRELRSGFAEVIKHALIGGQLSESLQLSESSWLETLRASIAVKVRIVQEDPLEKGLRALLNFGHTIGHAVESYFLETDEPLTHGEAVAIGMICESWRAQPPPRPPPKRVGAGLHSPPPPLFGVGGGGVEQGGFGGGVERETVETISRHFPHRPIPASAFHQIWDLMQQDKKNAAGKVRVAVPGAEPFSMQILEPSREEVEQSLLFYNGFGSL